MNSVIAYFRASGTGAAERELGKQNQIVQSFLISAQLSLAAQYVEQLSGAFAARREGPFLGRALVEARKNRYPIIVSDLSVLISDLGEFAELGATQARFIIASDRHPVALHAYGLAAMRKPQGQGNWGAARAAIDAARAVQVREADQHAEIALRAIVRLRSEGTTTLTAIAAELNGQGLPTPRGGLWHPSTVRNVLRRTGTL